MRSVCPRDQSVARSRRSGGPTRRELDEAEVVRDYIESVAGRGTSRDAVDISTRPELLRLAP